MKLPAGLPRLLFPIGLAAAAIVPAFYRERIDFLVVEQWTRHLAQGRGLQAMTPAPHREGG